MSIYTRVQEGFPDQEKMNCAEQILNAANAELGLGLSKESCKLSACFGGGMGVRSLCGAVAGSGMVLAHLYVKEYAHEGEREIARLTSELIAAIEEDQGSHMCRDLRPTHFVEGVGCKNMVLIAAKHLDTLLEREKAKVEAAQ